ncbi:MAG: SRPBCC family protein [Acidimicrobiales bacterium]
MDLTATVEVESLPERVRIWVADLDRYPAWLTIVSSAHAEVGSDPDAWEIELRAKVGPLARSKRLRMVRTVDEQCHVRFERSETDQRAHSPWVLDALLEPTKVGTRLTMGLHYGGSFGAGLFERLLADEIETSKQTLRSLVERDVDSP